MSDLLCDSASSTHALVVYIVSELNYVLVVFSGTVYTMTVEDDVLRGLYRAAVDAGRPGVAVPSVDFDVVAGKVGSRVSVSSALQRLAHSGRVVRVRRDLVVLPQPTGLLGVDLVDLVAAVAPRPYVITAGRALQHADLVDQHFFGVSVLVPSEQSPLRFRSQTATFFKTDRSNIWADVSTGGSAAGPVDGSDAHPCYASPARALVDSLNHSRFGVSLTQATDALFRAVDRDPEFLAKLAETVSCYSAGSRAHGMRAAARRVGFVVEHLFGSVAADPFRGLVGSNRAFIPLRPGGSSSGTVDRSWRLLVNAILEPESLVVEPMG